MRKKRTSTPPPGLTSSPTAPFTTLQIPMFYREDFQSMYLPRANFFGARAEQARFDDADLTGASFVHAQLQKTTFRRCHMANAYLTGADLTSADLSGADLTGADLTFTTLHRTNLTNANLRGANLRKARLTKTNLDGTDLSYTNLKETAMDSVGLLPKWWATLDVQLISSATNFTGASWADNQEPPLGWEVHHGRLRRSFDDSVVAVVRSTGCDVEFARVIFHAHPELSVEEMIPVFRALAAGCP